MTQYRFIALLIFLFFVSVVPSAYALDDTQIKKQIIQESIANYPGNCPCPYNTDRAGRSCGRRSAYTKPGGYAPICYPSDVTAEMIKEYKNRKN